MLARSLLASRSLLLRSRSSSAAQSGWRRGLSSTNAKPPPPPSSSTSKPDAETVQQLAESAKFQEKMWNTFVPERGVRFGDQRFWVLVGVVGLLHMINNYREAQKVAEPDLPPGAARRLPDGRLLMLDGSITAAGVDTSSHAHTLHKVATREEEAKGVINKGIAKFKDAV